MKKQQLNEEIAKVIEREQVISYKKKPTTKLTRDIKDDEEENQSAPSLKSGVFSEDSVRFNKKNAPLPELNREKKRIFSKNFIPDGKQVNNYLEKEVRQHENLLLKQKNNHLTTENMKLKTKIMTLEKQNNRLCKLIQQDPTKGKNKTGILLKDNKFKGSECLSLKMTIKNLRKELDDIKNQNSKIKCSIKFTTINELEKQRDAILEQTIRLRRLLEEEQFKRINIKVKEQGASNMEQKLSNVNEKCLYLMKENSQLATKLKKVEELSKKGKQSSENQKNLSKMLFNARRVIKQKEKELQTLKNVQTQKKIDTTNTIPSAIEIKSSKDTEKNTIFNHRNRGKDKDKRIMSKSAQKYRKSTIQNTGCQSCEKLKTQNHLLIKKIEELNIHLKEERQKSTPKNFGQFSRDQIENITSEENEKICRFLTFRFKAHHLGVSQAEKYLINNENVDMVKDQQISVRQVVENLVSEPFSVISNRYLQIILLKLFYGEAKSEKIRIDQNKRIKKKDLVENFKSLIPEYQIMPQMKEQQMFIQIAELITNYHQHILTALNRKRNGEGTIAQSDFILFFCQIELEKQYVDFIITQIILESLDLEHLNYYSMFQIFYMPPQQRVEPSQQQLTGPNKQKFQVDHAQIVKQEDQQYQQSRSYIDAIQKTQSNRDQQQNQACDNDYSPQGNDINKNLSIINEQVKKDETEIIPDEEQKQYEAEEYEEEIDENDKINQQMKMDEQIGKEENQPYTMEEVQENYEDEFY